MPEWLSAFDSPQMSPELPVLATRLLMAWALGSTVAWIARRNQPSDSSDSLTLTLILMSVLIAMATQIIGDNVARAFSLVGALSIVRFRTAMSSTRDVAFVLAAVVVGMAVGAGQYAVAMLGLLVVGSATSFNLRRSVPAERPDDSAKVNKTAWKLSIQAGLSLSDGWESELSRFVDEYQLLVAETTRRGSAMQMVYRVSIEPDANPVDILSALNLVPGVESVEMKAV